MINFGKTNQRVNGVARNGWPHLIVLLFAFFAGVFAGFFLAYLGGPNSELSGFLNEYFSYAAQGDLDISFISVIWDCVRWPLAIVVFSFSALGVILIPALLLARGFLLSYALSCFAVLLQWKGVVAGIALFSISMLVVLPVIFLFGCEGLRLACLRLPGALAASGGSIFRMETLLIGIGLLVVSFAVYWAAMPAIFSSVCTRLF